MIWKNRCSARVGGNDEELRQQSVVDGWGDGDAKKAEHSIAEVGMNL
jgi:hypothetical protein